MKICFFCDYPPLFTGNFIQSLFALEQKIQKKGGSCLYLFYKKTEERPWAQELRKQGKQILFVKEKGLREGIEVSGILKRHRIDILHAHFISASSLILIRLIHHSVRIIYHMHSTVEIPPPGIKTCAAYLKKYAYGNPC